MKKLFVFLMVIGLFVGCSGLAQAGYSYLTTPILGYNSSYTNTYAPAGCWDVLIYSGGSVPTDIPHSFLDFDDGLFGTGSPSMSTFSVGQQVHTGSGAYLDDDVLYGYSAAFNDLTTPARSISYSGGFTGSGGFWMTWNTPAGGGDGGGVPTLTNADIGSWTYVETYTVDGAPVLSSTTPFTVVPIPAAVWLLGSGLVGLVGIRRRFWK